MGGMDGMDGGTGHILSDVVAQPTHTLLMHHAYTTSMHLDLVRTL